MPEETAAQSGKVRVSVSYLGFIRDMTGTKEDRIELPEPAHIGDVLSKAAELHPRVAKVRDVLRASLNGAMTTENLELHDGDALSLMAPIVGG